MSESFPHFLAKLPAAQRELWPQLASLTQMGLVLHGGTAIALRLGHRESIDFVFFTERPLDRSSLLRALPLLNSSMTLQDEPDSFTALLSLSSGSVKVSFFGLITMGRVGKPELTSDGVLLVASLQDLMAQKLKVVMQRIESKDYLDIAALLRAGVSLETGMSGAMALYGANFSAMECAKALVYFKGGDLALVPKADRETLLKAVRELSLNIFPSAILSSSLA